MRTMAMPAPAAKAFIGSAMPAPIPITVEPAVSACSIAAPVCE